MKSIDKYWTLRQEIEDIGSKIERLTNHESELIAEADALWEALSPEERELLKEPGEEL